MQEETKKEHKCDEKECHCQNKEKHNWIFNEEESEEPTVYDEGYYCYYCSECEAQKTEIVPELEN